MSTAIDKYMDCPVCLDPMVPPIMQCVTGHSVCGACVRANNIKICPLCRSKMSTIRNYQLEDLISKLKVCVKIPCAYAHKGCKYELKGDEKVSHELECKNKTFRCEGKIYTGWNCRWTGNYGDILEHFKKDHNYQSWMEFKTAANMKINFDKDFKDIQIISFCSGQQIFWYKHKIDVVKKRCYWLFQYVGPTKQANTYYYEFEVYDGATRKFKVTEFCEGDTKNAEDIFDSERCVSMSFTAIKSYFNEKGELPFRFRIMKIKNDPVGLNVRAPKRPGFVSR